jgi:predicted molibdopterin-dependent oxidoreductase YjgC
MAALLAAREPAASEPQGTAAAAPGVQLFTYPLLVDEGRLSERADELKSALQDEPFVEIHPDTARAFGVAGAATLRVRTDAGEAQLPARITERIAPGAAFVPFNQPGFAANVLFSGSFETPATLEAVAAEEVPA